MRLKPLPRPCAACGRPTSYVLGVAGAMQPCCRRSTACESLLMRPEPGERRYVILGNKTVRERVAEIREQQRKDVETFAAALLAAAARDVLATLHAHSRDDIDFTPLAAALAAYDAERTRR